VEDVLGLLEQARAEPEQRRLAEQAVALDRQADLLARRGQQATARKLREQALEIREDLYPSTRYPHGNPFLIVSLNNVANLLHDQGESSKALAYLQRSRTLLETRYPEGHPLLAATLNDLGQLLLDGGESPKAMPYLQRAQTMWEALYPTSQFPKGHQDLARTLHRQADLFRARGDYAKALSYAQRGLAMCEALYPRDQYPKGHAHLAGSLSDIGQLLMAQGDYQRALPYVQRALAMCGTLYPKDQYPKGHPRLALCLRNMGALHLSQKEYQRAWSYLQQALAMCEALYPPREYPKGHPFLVELLERLAALFRARKGFQEALPYVQRALALCETLYPKDQFPRGHPRLALCLSNMGASLAAQGEYRRALPYLRRALMMDEVLYPRDRYPKGHPQLVEGLTFLGNALFLQGEYERALPYLQRALVANETLYHVAEYPRGHPQLSFSLRSLGALFHSRGEYQQALPYLQRAVAMDQDLTDAYVTAASEAEALNFAATVPLARDVLLSIPDQPQLSAEELYVPVWRGKAVIARIVQRRHQALADEVGAPAQRLWQELLDTRRNLSRLLLTPAGSSTDHRRQLRALTVRKEALERQLAQSLPGFRRRQLLELSPPTELIKKLPSGTTFIDLLRYVRIEPGLPAGDQAGRHPTSSYVAFVLSPNQPVRRVDLGRAEPIESALAEWRRDIADQKPSAAAERLSRLLWKPLAKHLPAGTRTVLLAPDGDLTRLPWAVLPVRTGGRVLLEDYAVAIVPHGPFLLDRFTAPPPAQERGLLLTVGGVRYDTGPPPDHRTMGEPPALHTDGRDGKEPLWSYLPRTLQEVDKVHELGGQRPAQTLRGAEASPERLLAELPRARWAHLATHGFFADPAFRSVLQVDERLYQRAPFGPERVAPGARNPLVLSGLVLSGADRAPENGADPGTADGILTAEALASLPLQNLQLVVLSACETGLGEVAGGEGVFGLQRAFHLAGAHSVVASLWKVDDAATQTLMEEFYRNLWQRKLGKLEALRQAQLVLLRSNDPRQGRVRSAGAERPVAPAQGAQAWPEKRLPPFFWAAWVLSGDPGDLFQGSPSPPLETTEAQAVDAVVPKATFASIFWYLSVGGTLVGGVLVLALLVRRGVRHARPHSR
jgi:CHAT domain-containing protein